MKCRYRAVPEITSPSLPFPPPKPNMTLNVLNATDVYFSCVQSIYHRLGDILARMDQWIEAERFHQAALEVQPDHVATHVSYGTMLARNVSQSTENAGTRLCLTRNLTYFVLIFGSYRVAERPRRNYGSSAPSNWLQLTRVFDIITVCTAYIRVSSIQKWAS